MTFQLSAAKVKYRRALEDMGEDQIAAEIAHLEDSDPKAGSFGAWALREAEAELDHRI